MNEIAKINYEEHLFSPSDIQKKEMIMNKKSGRALLIGFSFRIDEIKPIDFFVVNFIINTENDKFYMQMGSTFSESVIEKGNEEALEWIKPFLLKYKLKLLTMGYSLENFIKKYNLEL